MPRWLWPALALCFLAGLARAVVLMSHDPLIALANSYDEVRYTACFDLYPDRPGIDDPTRNSPEAPYSRYAFAPNPEPMCYWSTELLFQGATAAIYHLQHAMTGATNFSVRWIGALKFSVLVILWIVFGLAWIARGEPWSALANGLLLPIVFADPANGIYLNTFYAEWTALLTLYTLFSLVLLNDDRDYSRRIFIVIALAAFALAMSKIQHLVLPLACALAVLLVGKFRTHRWPWQGVAVLVGALLGIAVQGAQLQRESPAIEAINQFNRADVVFTGLLANASDPVATAKDLGLSADCLRFVGKSAWQIGDWPASACPELANVSRGRQLVTLAREPSMALRLWWRGLSHLDPWIAPGLGVVEGGDFAPLPDSFFSISRILSALPPLRIPPLAGPLVACLFLLWRGRWRAVPRLLVYSALATIAMAATITITVLGDGLADTPKQGHLIPNIALTWWITIAVLGIARVIESRSRKNYAP